MMSELLILAAPVALILAVVLWLGWEEKHWEARSRSAQRPVNVRPFPKGLPTYEPPLDVHRGRAARRARHGGAR